MVTGGMGSVIGSGGVRIERMVVRNGPSRYVEMWMWTFMPDPWCEWPDFPGDTGTCKYLCEGLVDISIYFCVLYGGSRGKCDH